MNSDSHVSLCGFFIYFFWIFWIFFKCFLIFFKCPRVIVKPYFTFNILKEYKRRRIIVSIESIIMELKQEETYICYIDFGEDWPLSHTSGTTIRVAPVATRKKIAGRRELQGGELILTQLESLCCHAFFTLLLWSVRTKLAHALK